MAHFYEWNEVRAQLELEGWQAEADFGTVPVLALKMWSQAIKWKGMSRKGEKQNTTESDKTRQS